MTKSEFYAVVDRVDIDAEHRPEPRKPPPGILDYVLGAALYGAIVGVAVTVRLIRSR